ncbi:uncharacterized protein LOC122331726 [Puntigrus tetrazona]|uniref:uncharacterized protein LOC122331726 n=1 Tax=Puntigrus tetrazona TaxID=1606681 RepID=UPI001C88EF1F|nr:uncharacterized protein LOC122331726 [Puntigrus tetrazona]
MASSNPRRRRNSLNIPPNISDSVRLFNELYDRHYPELQEIILALHSFVKIFEEYFKRSTEVSRRGGILAIAGGTIVIAGLVLAPLTMVASAAAAVGAGMALGGGIGSGLVNLFKMYQQDKLLKNIANGLKGFQNKIDPMADILNVISKKPEILKDLNTPDGDICYIMKCGEILRIIRIGDIGEVAGQMSKTVRLTAALTGVFAAIGLVLDILSVLEDTKALDDMDKLARNHQISEREMKSKAGTFIVKMRKVINQLQNIMDELKKTKDSIARGLDLM